MTCAVRILHKTLLALLGATLLVSEGCTAGGPRMTVVTGTTIGLKATPGDGNTRPPQVTLGYQRAETAFVPTKGEKATRGPEDTVGVDALSSLAAFFFKTHWFGNTEIASFITTGHAARDIQTLGSQFNDAFANATLGAISSSVKVRQDALFQEWRLLTEEQAKRILDLTRYPVKPSKTAKESLQDYLLTAETDVVLMKFEWALSRLH